METHWFFLVSLLALVIIAGVYMILWGRMISEHREMHFATLKALVQEWNKITQTINALTLGQTEGYPQGEAVKSPHRASDEAVSGMSPAKMALYRKRG